VRSVLDSPPSASPRTGSATRTLLVAGIAAFVLSFGGWLAYLAIHPEDWTLNMIDLHVYMDGGNIVRHVHGFYYADKGSPLYDWTRSGKDGLQFTYTPFAAVAFAVVSLMTTGVATPVWTVINFVALIAAMWFAAGGLGIKDRRVKAGVALLGVAVAIWLEPVFRNIYLGQINLVLMAAILWDLTQPDTRKNKGFVTGIAAGIKLVPIIFTPYLLITRKYRQAAATVAGFAVTVAIGFAVIPKDSTDYWFDGLFYQGGRTGFTAWLGNQSLDGLLSRLAGSIHAAKPLWAAASLIVLIAGLWAAKLLYDNGYLMPAILLTALTGDLVSPISWDHHWVWAGVDIVVAGYYAVVNWQAGRRWMAAVLAAGAAALALVFGAWPAWLWGESTKSFNFLLGIIWEAPNSNPFQTYYKHGDEPWYVEYHWHGIQLLAGNAYVLAGLAGFGILVITAILLPGTASTGTGSSATASTGTKPAE
jgi:alpha-1,2-mannosyltransferase